jgi:hypothetical protein
LEQTHYHVTTHTVTGLVKSENRECWSGADPENERWNTAEVILAFPPTGDEDPTEQSQNIFAFLPVREGNFKVREKPGKTFPPPQDETLVC